MKGPFMYGVVKTESELTVPVWSEMDSLTPTYGWVWARSIPGRSVTRSACGGTTARRALRDGYKGLTTPLFQAQSINAITNSRLAPGDIAVTADGAHVLAYLGDNHWIEADSGPMRTIIVATPTENRWFSVPVHILRWTQLLESPSRDLERTR